MVREENPNLILNQRDTKGKRINKRKRKRKKEGKSDERVKVVAKWERER